MIFPKEMHPKIQILQQRQTWRVYESSRSKYMNSKKWGFIL